MENTDLRKLADDLLTQTGRALARFNTSLFTLRASNGSVQHDDAMKVARYNVGKMAELLEDYEAKHREWRASLPQAGAPPEPKRAQFYLMIEADEHSFALARAKVATEMMALANTISGLDGSKLEGSSYHDIQHAGKALVGTRWRLASKIEDEDIVKNEASVLGTSCYKHVVKFKLMVSHTDLNLRDLMSKIADEIRWTATDVNYTDSPGSSGPGKFTELNSWSLEQRKV